MVYEPMEIVLPGNGEPPHLARDQRDPETVCKRSVSDDWVWTIGRGYGPGSPPGLCLECIQAWPEKEPDPDLNERVGVPGSA